MRFSTTILRTRFIWALLLGLLACFVAAEKGLSGEISAAHGVHISSKHELLTKQVNEFCKAGAQPFLAGATLYANPPVRIDDAAYGEIRVSFKQDVGVYLAAFWSTSDRDKGPWMTGALTEYTMYRSGWFYCGELEFHDSRRYATHQLYWRLAKAGEILTLRTRKTGPPMLIVPAGVDLNLPEIDPNLTMDGKTEHKIFSARIEQMLREGKYDELDRIVAQIRRDKPRNKNGRAKLSAFYDGTAPSAETDEQWEEERKVYEAWSEAKPKSAAAQIALARFWYGYAFQGRRLGGGRYPTAEGMELYRARMKVSQAIIEKQYGLEEKCPYAPRFEIALAYDNAYSKAEVDAILKRAWETDPDYTPAFLDAVRYYLPTMHGDPGDLEAYADRACAMTSSRWGDELYAQIVLEAADYRVGETFKSFKFDWERVKKSAAAYRKRYPESITELQRYARLAGFKGDREEAAAAFTRLDELGAKNDVYVERWREWAKPNLLAGDQLQVSDAALNEVFRLDWTLDGSRWIVLDGGPGLAVWDAAEAKIETRVKFGRTYPKYAAAIPLGKAIAWAGHDDAVSMVKIPSGQVVELGTHAGGILSAALSSDGGEWATTGKDNKIRYWNLDDPQAGADVWDMGTLVPTAIAYVPGTNRVLVGDREKKVTEWDRDTKRKLSEFPACKSAINRIRVSADGSMLAILDSDEIQLWRLKDRRLTASLPLPKQPINDLAFSRDGRYLAAGTGVSTNPVDCEALVWNTADGTLKKKFLGHKLKIYTICFSPDGSKLATGSRDMTIRVWKVD